MAPVTVTLSLVHRGEDVKHELPPTFTLCIFISFQLFFLSPPPSCEEGDPSGSEEAVVGFFQSSFL